MKDVLISKEKLLAKIKENRESHVAEFKEAVDGWKEKVIVELSEALGLAELDTEYKTYFTLPKPTDHIKEYDAIIAQIEWTEIDQISLGLNDFNKFIRDDWDWKEDFMTTNAFYSKMK